MNQAEQSFAQVQAHAELSRDFYFPDDWDGDYKDAAAVHQQMLVDAADELGIRLVVEIDAYSCPRRWKVSITAPDGSFMSYPE